MNGKLAKRLRRQAEASTIGLPDIKYQLQKVHKIVVDKIVQVSTIVLGNCTRKEYKRLKKEMKC